MSLRVVLVLVLLTACGGKREDVVPAAKPAAPADAATVAPLLAAAADPDLPPGNVVLTGRMSGQSEPKVIMKLHFDPAQPSGTLSYDDGVTTYSLRQPKLELVGKKQQGGFVLARY